MKNKIFAVIFDLDGTVLDNEGEWEEAFVAVSKSFDLDLKSVLRQPNGWIHEPGAGLKANWKRILGAEHMEIDELVAETRGQYMEIMKEPESVRVKNGIDSLLEQVKDKGWMTGLATGSEWHIVEQELEQVYLIMGFDVTTTGEEVLLPKPDPEIYTLSIQKMGIDPEQCVVIEDSLAGVRSAVEAGCRVCAISSDYAPEEMLRNAGAEWVVGDIANIWEILATLEPEENEEDLVE